MSELEYCAECGAEMDRAGMFCSECDALLAIDAAMNNESVQELPDNPVAGHMDIWDRVSTTDPDHTRPGSAGGRTFTSISGLYQIRRATELFGPIGIGWGYRIVRDEIIDARPIWNDGIIVAQEKIHSVDIALWYLHPTSGLRGEVFSKGHTRFVYTTSYGIQVDADYGKKSATDAIKKALSMLGFSADIYLGQYDDVEYVAELKDATEVAKAVDPEAVKARQSAEFYAWYAKVLAEINNAPSARVADILARGASPRIDRQGTAAQSTEFHALVTSRIRELERAARAEWTGEDVPTGDAK
jgi:hypothetical protein